MTPRRRGPTIPAVAVRRTPRARRRRDGDGGPGRAADRRRAGPPVPDRLRGDAARAPDDARPSARRGPGHRRPASRARRRRGRVCRHRGRDPRPGRRPTIRTRSPPSAIAPIVGAGARDLRLDCWRCTSSRLQRALGPDARYELGLDDPARPPDAQGRRGDRAAARGRPRRRSGRRPDRGAVAWSGGPRQTSLARFASGSSPRATTRRCSRSSPPGRTRPRRTTRPRSASSRPASRSCSTSAARSAATARTSRGRSG